LRVVCETENMNFCGWAANNRFSRVDFPVPDGPEITMGRFSAEDIVVVALGMDRGILIRRREGVLLVVEGMSLEGLRKRVRKIRVIRSLSLKNV